LRASRAYSQSIILRWSSHQWASALPRCREDWSRKTELSGGSTFLQLPTFMFVW